MGIVNTKDFLSRKRVDEATSNTSLSNVRYVITEKPKWKVFKKKEVVPLPQYRQPKGCNCGNDSPCKQKVTPKGVTIHYPKKKRRFSIGLDRRYKPPKLKKINTSRLPWKSPNNALPFQTRFQTNMNISIPQLNIGKFIHAIKILKSKTPSFATINQGIKKFNNVIKSLRSIRYHIKKKPKRSMSDFMFMPFMFGKYGNPRPPTEKVKVVRPKKFLTWRLDKLSYNTPFASTRPPPVASVK